MSSSRAAGRVFGFAHCLPPRRSRHFVDNGWRPRGERDTCKYAHRVVNDADSVEGGQILPASGWNC